MSDTVRRLEVGALTAELGALVAGVYEDVEVVGEVSGFKVATSGHWYFSLKDSAAVISCSMWKFNNQRMRRVPREGEKIAARGSVEVYAPRGSYSLVVRQLTAVGIGDLAKRLAELKARLGAEGLFDPSRKRPLPPFPRVIGVATSGAGAALQDVLRVVRERHPKIPILVAPCVVQGASAAEDVARAVRLLDEDGRADVIIVGRGGGSAEDLFAFNEEPVVRAVAACRVPVISAVGHQTDFTLCDQAADVRAATPSHAAELATPVLLDIYATLDDQLDRLQHAMKVRVDRARDRVKRTRLVHPRQRLDQGRMRLEELEERLRAAMAMRRARAGERLSRVRLPDLAPRAAASRLRVVQADARMRTGVARRRSQSAQQLAALVARLDALSPLAVLTRGYAIAHANGRVVRDAAAVSVGDLLEIRVGEGALDARVERVRAGSADQPNSARR